jgi:hypothetical protein
MKVTRSIEIGLIEIMKEHCLIALDASYKDQLLKAFNRNKYKGIPIVASLTENKTERKGRRKSEHPWQPSRESSKKAYH